MKFYKIMAAVVRNDYKKEGEERHNYSRTERNHIAFAGDDISRVGDDEFFFLVEFPDEVMTIGIICKNRYFSRQKLLDWVNVLGFDIDNVMEKETTFRELSAMLSFADENNFIGSDNEVLSEYGLDRADCQIGRSVDCYENLLDGPKSEKTVMKEAERLFAKETLNPEIGRIYAGRKGRGMAGHPVHYMVQCDDYDTRREIYRTILHALYSNDRIMNLRYIYFDVNAGDELSVKNLESVYGSVVGGAAVIRYTGTESEESDYAGGERLAIEKLCTVIKEYSNEVLTVICFPRECTKSKAIFLERLPDIGFVEVEEELLRGERTKNYLKMLAKEAGARADKKLYEKVSLEKQYLPTELKKIFRRWYSRKMRETVYPQYAHIKETGYEAAKNQPKGSAYQELDSMIGLTEAKAVIKRATSFFKARKLFAEKGMKEEHPSMHMVFSGNPGTAKTSTARLFAEIMREEGILSRGHLLEVGRSDLVGKFVGWTAKIVRQKFKEAEGGVLFIDEAYSLVDDRNGSYGDEAINTIVQEMENHRENVVVIFAGYPDKMQEFLDKNPGLRSRIAFHVPFADYSDDELCDIARFLARKKGLTLTEDACERLRTVFTTERRKPDFGNGRIVRNVLEKAQMVQAERLMAMDYDSVTKEDITTITGADIELPEAPKSQRKALGFSVA